MLLIQTQLGHAFRPGLTSAQYVTGGLKPEYVLELVRGGWGPGCCFLGRAPHPCSHPSWAQVGWGGIREGFSRHGKEEPFLASDTRFRSRSQLQTSPMAVRHSVLAQNGLAKVPGAGTIPLPLGLDPGGLCFLICGKQWLMPYFKGASRRVYSPRQRPPKWAGLTPCCLSLGHQTCYQ